MHWRLYSLVSFFVLLSHHHALADELVPSPLVPNTRIETEAASAELRLSAQDLLGVTEHVRRRPSSGGEDRKEPLTTLIANEQAYHLGPPLLALPAPVQDLVGPWLPRLTRREPPVVFATKTKGYPKQSLGHAEKKTPIPRVDKVWRVAPVGALARTYDGMTIDGGFDLGLEVRAGSTKKDRATNAIKGTTNTQISLLPANSLQQRLGRYLSTLGRDDERGHASKGQLRMVLATNGEYAINPSTRDITPKGEAVGTLSWMTPPSDRFTHDPWQVVAFRWHPTVSCEGRSIIGEEANKAEAKWVPLATLTGNLGGDLRLDFLSPQLSASGNYQYGQRLTDTQTKWEQATFSWKYQLNSQVSLGGSFTQDKREPNQQIERAFKLEMGVKF